MRRDHESFIYFTSVQLVKHSHHAAEEHDYCPMYHTSDVLWPMSVHGDSVDKTQLQKEAKTKDQKL